MELVDRIESYEKEKEEFCQELHDNPIDLDALFASIDKTLRHDYVGFEAKEKYYRPEEYRLQLSEDYREGMLTIDKLIRSLHQFIGELNDPHLRFVCEDWIDNGSHGTDYGAGTIGEVDYPIEFKPLDDFTSYLKLESLSREIIDDLLEAHKNQLAQSRKLIIDLRRCVGGEEDAWYGLLPYLVDRECRLSELINDEGSYLLFSEANCDCRLDSLQMFKDMLTDAEQIAIIDEEMDRYRTHRGKGLAFVPPEPLDDDPLIVPAENGPEQVILITDTFCENEGEQFVAMARRCGAKVKVIGRPTMGTLDYFDNIYLPINAQMGLSYPIRMTKAAFDGEGISEKGLPVDEYIAWTPDEITEDVLLQRALAL